MLAVVGGKGGVGKTTTALGLGAAMARAGRHPLVVDCDEDMPDCRRMAGIRDRPGLGAVAAGTPPEAVTVALDRFDGMAVLTARPGAPVDAALEALPGQQPTILDAPAGAGPPTAVVLRRASRSLIVTSPTTEAIEDAIKTVATARSLAARPVGLVLTRAETVPRRLEDRLGIPLLCVVPNGGQSPLETEAVKAAYDGLAAKIGGNI